MAILPAFFVFAYELMCTICSACVSSFRGKCRHRTDPPSLCCFAWIVGFTMISVVAELRIKMFVLAVAAILVLLRSASVRTETFSHSTSPAWPVRRGGCCCGARKFADWANVVDVHRHCLPYSNDCPIFQFRRAFVRSDQRCDQHYAHS